MDEIKRETKSYLNNVKKYQREFNKVDKHLLGTLIETLDEINKVMSTALYTTDLTSNDDYSFDIDDDFFRYQSSILCVACNVSL